MTDTDTTSLDADGLRRRVRALLREHDPAATDRLDFLQIMPL